MPSLTKLKSQLYFVVAKYFVFWANISYKRWQPRTMALTGSVGKTTLLNLLEVQLANKAHYSHNANSIYGISFDILGLTGITGSKVKWLYLFFMAPVKAFTFTHKQEFYIVEIDGERPKETELLARWLRPEVTLWVSFGRSHAVQFDQQVRDGSFKTVDAAILNEFSWLPKLTQKAVIYNATNKDIVSVVRPLKLEKFPITNKAITAYEVWPNKTVMTVNGLNYSFNQPLPKEVFIQVAMVTTLANYLNIKPVTNFKDFVQPPGRSNFYDGIKHTKIIDSSYNAHLISMESMIDLYKEMQVSGERWIIIGDIVDQGETEAEQHTQLGKALKQANFDKYIFVGRRTSQYTYPQLPSQKAVSFLHPRDALKYIKGEIEGGETLLFKGSQYLEGIIAELLADKTNVASLPRQDKAAKKRRARWGLS